MPIESFHGNHLASLSQMREEAEEIIVDFDTQIEAIGTQLRSWSDPGRMPHDLYQARSRLMTQKWDFFRQVLEPLCIITNNLKST